MRFTKMALLGLMAGLIPSLPSAVFAQHYEGEYDTPGSRRLGIFKRPQGLVHLYPLPEDRIDCVKRWSYEDYQIRGQLPTGVRQREFKGRMWPIENRPVGPKPHLIHRYHDTHYWPYPHIYADRASVGAFIEMQKASGWREATTLYSYHFSGESNEITDAGIQHIQWILQDAPAHFRTLYVQTSAEAGINEIRTQQVRDVAARLMAGAEIPPIELINSRPSGRPADEILSIRNGEMASQPLPRIEYTAGGFDSQ